MSDDGGGGGGGGGEAEELALPRRSGVAYLKRKMRKVRRLMLLPVRRLESERKDKKQKKEEERQKRRRRPKSLSPPPFPFSYPYPYSRDASSSSTTGSGFRPCCFRPPGSPQHPAPSSYHSFVKDLLEKNDFFSPECHVHRDRIP